MRAITALPCPNRRHKKTDGQGRFHVQRLKLSSGANNA